MHSIGLGTFFLTVSLTVSPNHYLGKFHVANNFNVKNETFVLLTAFSDLNFTNGINGKFLTSVNGSRH